MRLLHAALALGLSVSVSSSFSHVVLADQAKTEGIWDIRTSGLSKVRAGVTSLAEVNRVTVE